MGIIDSKDAHSLFHPKKNHIPELNPKRAPFRALEIERENILIKFRWIFGILDCAVRTGAKPFAMLFDIRVVRRALERNIESPLKSVFPRARDEALEILQCSQLAVNGSMTAFVGADGPGTAHIIVLRRYRIIFSLSERLPDRMDRREINDIETHGRDVR